MQKLLEELGTVYYRYDIIVTEAIREKYSASDELALLRQRESKPDEFAEYNTYVEDCKTRAKEKWSAQESAIAALLQQETSSTL